MIVLFAGIDYPAQQKELFFTADTFFVLLVFINILNIMAMSLFINLLENILTNMKESVLFANHDTICV